MVEHRKLKKGALDEFIIRPNPSLAWKTIKKIYVVLSIVILFVAGLLTYINAYLALPFYGLEFGLLSYALYKTCYQSTFVQILRFSNRKIEIENIQGKKKNIMEFNRDWSKFRLIKGYFNQPIHIAIRSHGKDTQIAHFISEEERLILYKKIQCL